MENTPRQLSKEELLSGKITGIHQLQEPLTGYKVVHCVCSLWNAQYSAIAEVEIPKDATIVRYAEYQGHNVPTEPSKGLRTDRAIFKDVVYRDTENAIACGFMPSLFKYFSRYQFTTDIMMNYLTDCKYYSTRNLNYEYKIGQEHRPEKELDRDHTSLHVTDSYGSGIYFYPTRKEADDRIAADNKRWRDM